jgi:hypothetical protein
MSASVEPEAGRSSAIRRARIRARLERIGQRLSPPDPVGSLGTMVRHQGRTLGDALGSPQAAPIVAAALELGTALLTQKVMSKPQFDVHPPVFPYARATRNGLRRTRLALDEAGQWQAHFVDDVGRIYSAAADEAGHRAGMFIDSRGRRHAGFIDELGYPVRDFYDELGNSLDEASGWAAHDWGHPSAGGHSNVSDLPAATIVGAVVAAAAALAAGLLLHFARRSANPRQDEAIAETDQSADETPPSRSADHA